MKPAASLSPVTIILMFGGCFALWEIASAMGLVDPFIVSRPSWILEEFLDQVRRGLFWGDLQATLWEFFIGYSLATIVGISGGLIFGWYRRVRFAFEPVLWFLYNAPLVAFYPLLIVWLGLGSPTIIALAFLLAFFPVYVNTVTGVMTVNPVLIQCARSFGANTLKIFWYVILPATMPAVVAGLRLGVGRALIGVVVGELIGGSAGLGFRMSYAANHIDATLYFVAFLATTVIGFTLTDLLKRLEDRLHRYREL